jgi:hypothetical protein
METRERVCVREKGREEILLPSWCEKCKFFRKIIPKNTVLELKQFEERENEEW